MMVICDHWFHAVFIQQSSGRKNKIFDKNMVKRMFTLELHITFVCVCVCVCVCRLYLRIVVCGHMYNC